MGFDQAGRRSTIRAASTALQGALMRLTFLGTGTARPLADTAASGILMESEDTAVLFDIGSGIASRVEATIGALNLSGIVIGHFHADHWIDLAPLRYRFPWGDPAPAPCPLYLPPGGRDHLEHLATAINERAGFFDPAFSVTEYQSGHSFRIGSFTITPHPVGHYVPAWSMDIQGPDARVVYAGDMGPAESVIELARGADALIVEATLEDGRMDDARRGHMDTNEAIDHVRRSGVTNGFLVHYPSERRARMEALCAASGVPVRPALPGLVAEIGRSGAGRHSPQEIVRTG
jgi:ribonuclease BN (tRNA processing enzyme)